MGFLTFASGFTAIFSLVQGLLVARWLGPEQYGLAALILSYPALLYTLFDARSSEASVKSLTEFHAKGDREAVLAMCGLGLVIDLGVALLAFTIVGVGSSWISSNLIHREGLGPLIVLYSAALISRAWVGTSYAVLACLGRFKIIAWIDFLSGLARAVMVLACVLMGMGVTGVILGNSVATILSGLAYFTTARTVSRRTWGGSWLSGRWHVLKPHLREIAHFLALNDVNALIGLIPKQLDVLLLGYFRNPVDTGNYKLAKSIAAGVGYLVGPLQSVAYPKLASLSLGDGSALRDQIRKFAFAGVVLGALGLVGARFIPAVLPLLVGESYSNAAAPAVWLTSGMAVWMGLFWLRPLYLAKGWLREWTINLLLMSLPCLVLWFILSSRYGSVSVAIVWTGSIVLGHGVFAFLGWRRLSTPWVPDSTEKATR